MLLVQRRAGLHEGGVERLFGGSEGLLREMLRNPPPNRARGWPPFTINLFIGPEGGFSNGEVALARRYGLLPLTLGPRILRTETAGLVATAALLYELGDLE